MRSHFCGELNESNVDEDVVLCGWIHRSVIMEVLYF